MPDITSWHNKLTIWITFSVCSMNDLHFRYGQTINPSVLSSKIVSKISKCWNPTRTLTIKQTKIIVSQMWWNMNIFSKFFACVDNFFKYNLLLKFFLFQLIIFPIEKSRHKYFFQTFLVHKFFFFLFPLLDFYFCFFPTPTPTTFLMVRP